MTGHWNLPSGHLQTQAGSDSLESKGNARMNKVFSLDGSRLKNLKGCAVTLRMHLWGVAGAETVLLPSRGSKKPFSFLDTLDFCQPPAKEPKTGLRVRPIAWEFGPATSRETGLHLGSSLPRAVPARDEEASYWIFQASPTFPHPSHVSRVLGQSMCSP